MKLVLICDIVIALVLILCTVRGLAVGFVKSASGFVTLIGACVLAYLLGTFATELICDTEIYSGARDGIKNVIVNKIDLLKNDGLEKAEQSRKSFENSEMAKTLSRIGLDLSDLFEKYESSLEESAGNASENFASEAAEKVAYSVARALGTVIVFVISFLLLKLMLAMLSLVTELPVIKTFNKAGGLVLGFAAGIAACFLICTVIEVLIPCIPKNPVIYAGMERDTFLYSFFLNLNPVFLLFFG